MLNLHADDVVAVSNTPPEPELFSIAVYLFVAVFDAVAHARNELFSEVDIRGHSAPKALLFKFSGELKSMSKANATKLILYI